MSVNFDQSNDHEVRLRVLERIAEGIERKFDKIEAKMDSQFHWVMGIIFTVFVALLLAKLI